jgi:hypothetical protein
MKIHPKTCEHETVDLSCNDCRRILHFSIYLDEKKQRIRVSRSINECETYIKNNGYWSANAYGMVSRETDFLNRLTKSISDFHTKYGNS